MTKVLSISNHKGGVGKTTSTINIAAALANQKKRVLVIDLDPQSNLSQSLAIENTGHNIYGALRGEYSPQPIEIIKNFHVIPATTDLAAAEVELSNQIDREYYLKDIIDKIKDSYDYVLIDCPPSLGILTLNAFTASDEIIIPLQSEYLATQGLAKLVEITRLMQKRLNPSLIIGGVFLTQYDGRKTLNRDVLEIIQDYFKEELYNTKIRDNVSLAEAPSQGMDIFRYAPKSFGAEDYQALSKEIIKKHVKTYAK